MVVFQGILPYGGGFIDRELVVVRGDGSQGVIFAANRFQLLTDERMFRFGGGGCGLLSVWAEDFVLVLEGCRST